MFLNVLKLRTIQKSHKVLKNLKASLYLKLETEKECLQGHEEHRENNDLTELYTI